MATQAAAAGMYLGGEVVASKTGNVYYFPWCPGGQNIPPQYQQWFKDEATAKAAGFVPAKNCKGLVQ